MTDTTVRERLIEAAARRFAANGFSASSTRDIARLAGVNECSLFRLFGTKQDLFWAALRSRVAQIHPRKTLTQALKEDAPLETALRLIIEFLVDISIYHPEFVRLLGASWMELRPQAEIVQRKAVAPMLQNISAYFARATAAGQVPPVDPAITAVGLAATVLAHHTLSPMLNGVSRPYASSEEAVSAYSRYWLRVLTTPACAG